MGVRRLAVANGPNIFQMLLVIYAVLPEKWGGLYPGFKTGGIAPPHPPALTSLPTGACAVRVRRVINREIGANYEQDSSSSSSYSYLENEQKQEVGVGYALELLEEVLGQESDDAVLGRRYVIVLQRQSNARPRTHTHTPTHTRTHALYARQAR